MKSVKSLLIRKETKSLQQAAIRRAEYGLRMLAMNYKCSMATKMKYFPAPSTTKVIQSLQAPKITLAASGKILI